MSCGAPAVEIPWPEGEWPIAFLSVTSGGETDVVGPFSVSEGRSAGLPAALALTAERIIFVGLSPDAIRSVHPTAVARAEPPTSLIPRELDCVEGRFRGPVGATTIQAPLPDSTDVLLIEDGSPPRVQEGEALSQILGRFDIRLALDSFHDRKGLSLEPFLVEPEAFAGLEYEGVPLSAEFRSMRALPGGDRVLATSNTGMYLFRRGERFVPGPTNVRLTRGFRPEGDELHHVGVGPSRDGLTPAIGVGSSGEPLETQLYTIDISELGFVGPVKTSTSIPIHVRDLEIDGAGRVVMVGSIGLTSDAIATASAIGEPVFVYEGMPFGEPLSPGLGTERLSVVHVTENSDTPHVLAGREGTVLLGDVGRLDEASVELRKELADVPHALFSLASHVGDRGLELWAAEVSRLVFRDPEEGWQIRNHRFPPDLKDCYSDDHLDDCGALDIGPFRRDLAEPRGLFADPRHPSGSDAQLFLALSRCGALLHVDSDSVARIVRIGEPDRPEDVVGFVQTGDRDYVLATDLGRLLALRILD